MYRTTSSVRQGRVWGECQENAFFVYMYMGMNIVGNTVRATTTNQLYDRVAGSSSRSSMLRSVRKPRSSYSPSPSGPQETIVTLPL